MENHNKYYQRTPGIFNSIYKFSLTHIEVCNYFIKLVGKATHWASFVCLATFQETQGPLLLGGLSHRVGGMERILLLRAPAWDSPHGAGGRP